MCVCAVTEYADCAGVSGAFLGNDDEYFGILGVDRKTVDVYETGESQDNPLCSLAVKEGGVLMLFPGPKLPAPE